MRLSTPRIPALPPQQWDAATTKLLAPMVARGSDLNVFRTLANHPDLLRRWMVFTNHVMFKSTLPQRVRELLILRVGFLCGSEYEWGVHAMMARQSGMSDEDLRAIQAGPGSTALNESERLLMQATDELHNDNFVTEAAWQGLSAHFDTRQMMDIVFTVGQYKLVSMMLNTFGVQPDPGLPGFEL